MNEKLDKESFSHEFGKFVRRKRRKMGWKQTDLAAKLNNNFQNISRLEQGGIIPSIFWCLTLAQAFEMSLSDLFLEFEEFLKEVQ